VDGGHIHSILPDQYAYWLARYPGPQNGDPVD